MTEPYTPDPRIAALVDRFDLIGELSMRDLPIYNPALGVEAIGFRRLGDDWVGVLVTPWFMNLMVLPQDKQPMDMTRIGAKTEVNMPSGTWRLTHGGDEVIGSYKALSLHSPVNTFKTRELARAEADRHLAAFLKPGEDEPPSAGVPDPQAPAMSRRAFLGGRRSGAEQ